MILLSKRSQSTLSPRYILRSYLSTYLTVYLGTYQPIYFYINIYIYIYIRKQTYMNIYTWVYTYSGLRLVDAHVLDTIFATHVSKSTQMDNACPVRLAYIHSH